METNFIERVSEIDTLKNTASVSDGPDAEITSEETDTFRTEKTFTQKELDDIVRNRLDRAKKDIPSKEELQAFREWQESRAEAEQKSAEQLAAVSAEKEASENARRALEIRVACLSKGVAPEYADDVIAIAERYADENTPITAAVDQVIAKYPVFCGRNFCQAASGITTGVRTQAIPERQSAPASFIDIVKENQAKRN